MRIELPCPLCRSQLAFSSDGLPRQARPLVAHCGTCGRSYRLWGGLLTELAGPPPLRSRGPSVGPR